MDLSDKFIAFVQKVLPSPMTIAVLLTFITIALLFVIQPEQQVSSSKNEIVINGKKIKVSKDEYYALAEKYQVAAPETQTTAYPLLILQWWEKGFWELLEFAMQMALILVLGHALALTPFFNSIIQKIVSRCTNTASAASIIAFFAIIMGFFNWGLGLIFGALLARKAAEHAVTRNIPFNYPLVGAAGYAGMLVWHGGLSGSAPLTVAGAEHFLVAQAGVIPVDLTLFSAMNISATVAILILVPLLFYFTGKKQAVTTFDFSFLNAEKLSAKNTAKPTGAEKLDHAKWLAYLFAFLILSAGIYKALHHPGGTLLSFITLNYVNFILFGMGVLLHGSISRYAKAVDEAVGGAAGILIQFPIYAGIMGMMKYSGLLLLFADFFVSISNAVTLPLFTFISAAVVNLFVPSGGGQWAVQGAVVVQSALDTGISLPKNIMAFAYGDQLTNMIQPFWALPLLGITGLKAKEILPYTFLLMLAGILVYGGVLLIF